MRYLLALALCLTAAPAFAKKEAFWIETLGVQVALHYVCGAPMNVEAVETAGGAAMIQYALSKRTVLARAEKRGRAIANDVTKQHSQAAFCGASMYYIKNGYPR